MVHMILLTVFIVVQLVLIGLILVQRSKGGGLSGAFGGGGGSDTFLGAIQNKEIVKVTTYLAVGFVFLAILLDFIPPGRRSSEVEELSVAPMSAPQDPAASAPATGEQPVQLPVAE